MSRLGTAPLSVLAPLFLTALLGACSGDAPADDLPLADRLTQQAGTPATTIVAPPPVAATPSSTSASMPTDPPPTPAPTPDAATVLQVRTLGTLVLTEADVPGYTARTRQPAFKQDIVLAQVAIPKLASYFEDSNLRGSWATLLSNPGPPETGISSIVYLFQTPAGANGLVEVSSRIGVKDYLSATEAQVLDPPLVGDTATLLRYNTLNGRSLELTWAQGPLAGQVILRTAADAEAPGDADRVVKLAQMQAARMATFLP